MTRPFRELHHPNIEYVGRHDRVPKDCRHRVHRCLRDGFYLDFTEALVGDDDVIRGPAGDGRASFVARCDVARTAATILVDPTKHSGHTYDLTGPEALSLAEVAGTIGRVRGRNISYHHETVEEAYASRAGYGAPDCQVDAWVSTYTAIRSGVMAPLSSAVRDITGTSPISLETFLHGTST